MSTGAPALPISLSHGDGMDPVADPCVTVFGLEQIIVTLPYQLGFHPRESLVLIGLGDSPRAPTRPASATAERVILSARVDLPPPGEHAGALSALVPALDRPETSAVVAVVFSDAAPATSLRVAELLARVGELALRRSVAVRAATWVCGRRWRVVSGHDGPGPWRPLPSARDVPAVADYVAAGRAPARDRATLEGLLSPADADLAAAVRALLEDRRTYGAPGCVPTPTTAQARDAAAVLAELLAGARGTEPLPGATAIARTASALHHVPLRDTLLSRVAGTGGLGGSGSWSSAVHPALQSDVGVDRAAASRLARAGAHVPHPWAAPWLTVTGFVAWQAGDGALANITVEAALRADPGYTLARLLSLALRSALPPSRLRTAGGAAPCV